MYINHNGMASNVANTLTSHYSNLATSTERLSSGLRVNSAADDAAGLAIRELMRADIAALNQGVRNANDAISLIQTADGALGIIDEKLIRMKELAEQAATGTYDSTQRLMIESEYQAMASEITRIANATDFNGMKLLNGDLEGAHDGSELTAKGEMKIHFGTANDSAEDYYYIRIEEMTAQALGVGNASTAEDVRNRGLKEFKESLTNAIKDDNTLSDADRSKMLAQVDEMAKQVENAVKAASTDPMKAFDLWSASDKAADGTGTDNGFLADGKIWEGSSSLLDKFMGAGAKADQSAIDKFAQDAADAVPAAETADETTIDGLFDASVAKFTSATALPDTLVNWTDSTAYKAAGQEVVDNIVADFEQALKAKGLDLTDAQKTSISTDLKTAWDNADTSASGNNSTATSLAADDRTAIDTALKAVKGTNTVVDDDLPLALSKKTAADAAPKSSLEAYQQAYDEEFAANNNEDQAKAAGEAAQQAFEDARTEAFMNDFWNDLSDTQKEKLTQAFQKAAVYNLTHQADTNNPTQYGLGGEELDFGALAGLTGDTATKANEFLSTALGAMGEKVASMDFAGFTIETQEDAQHALVALNDAIVAKDKTRAHLGALQNRLENTVSNLTVQSENLQAAESRISDVDVATEMTNFVRNQILTQSAVAMLSQANSMPQMAMQLIH